MRTRTAIIAAIAAVACSVSGIQAQGLTRIPAFPAPQEVGTHQGPTWESRLLTGLGGAALGAALGFFASQIDRSDWAETPGRTESNRALWSAVGGGIGLAIGVSFPLGGGRAATGPGLPGTLPRGRSVILRQEIQELSAENALDVIEQLRPEWLNARPPSRLGELDEVTVPVYLDDFRYGEIQSLRQIHVHDIESIRFIPASVATARWGVGHAAGVIQVIAVG
jgi:hypothetical protein